MITIEVNFKEEEENDEPQPLRVEHFYFPFGTWVVGILLSVLCLLTEIIIHCKNKSKTDVTMATLEEPGLN